MALQTKAAVAPAAANGKNGHSLISDAKFRQLYALALRLQHGSAGGEAALAGIVADLRSGDLVIGNGAASLAGALHEEMPGVRVAPAQGDAQASMLEALRAAVNSRVLRSGQIAVILLSGGAPEPQLREAHAIAEGAKLPVLFVEGAERGAKGRAGSNGKEPEVPSIPVDAHDAVAMYRVAHESIARAREGGGPTRILCVEPPTLQERRGGFRLADAVAHLEHWLAARGLPAQAWREEITGSPDHQN
jgi:TPP-dependent pyruvate/acetoin dehydrogenase alpha subunit